jgi:uncharacterized protein (TIGR02145 family)
MIGINIHERIRIPIKKSCNGYYIRWYYNGWHYWYFQPGTLTIATEGEQYRTYGHRRVLVGSGQITRGQALGIRTIMMTREVSMLTLAGWMNIRVEPGSMNVYNNDIAGTEVEFIVVIGSKEVSYTNGYTPVPDVVVIVPPEFSLYCEVNIGLQTWMCKNWDSDFPGSRVYDNDEANRNALGGLYTHNQIMSAGFVPSGWRVPNNSDIDTLIAYLSGDALAGGRLKGIPLWNVPNAGVFDSGFNAVGGGYCDDMVNFMSLYDAGIFWVTNNTDDYADTFILNNTVQSVDRSITLPRSYFASLRLIKGSISDPIPSYVTDMDGNIYTVITIGLQQWMVENLKTTKYADGTTIPNLTISSFSDWFLPSKDELIAMYDELCFFGIGGFSTGVTSQYICSSEINLAQSWGKDFATGITTGYPKNAVNRIRPCRFFTSITNYNLRDIGPAGGWIFWKSGNDYLETAPFDTIQHQWSNIINLLVGTGTAIGTGQANTTAIIGQPSHTDSAAKLCDDLITGGWVNDLTGAYCWYNNDISNKTPYGALYNWYAVNNARQLAVGQFTEGGVPSVGWRVPGEIDFDNLITFLGGAGVTGRRLKEIGFNHWDSPNAGTDDYGFKALGSGFRQTNGVFTNLKLSNLMITTDAIDALNAWSYDIANDDDTLWKENQQKAQGFTVRCMRDL